MKEKLNINVRDGFSDRQGIKKENTEMQYKNLEKMTRIRLLNFTNGKFDSIYKLFDKYLLELDYTKWDIREDFVIGVKSGVFNQEIDYSDKYFTDRHYEQLLEDFNEVFNNCDYSEVLTLLEFVVGKYDFYFHVLSTSKSIEEVNIYEEYNYLFTREYIGYRFVNKQIVSITDNNEIESINDAIKNPYDDVRAHLEKSLTLLSDRVNPDYENSVKESISAVEALCCILVNNSKATLGQALKKLEDSGIVVHPAMGEAFSKLYGYSSDTDGIRHGGGLGDSTTTFDEAKYMLVSCSAFTNYLLSKKSKIK